MKTGQDISCFSDKVIVHSKFKGRRDSV
jgi:hypothetical protein